MKSYLFIILAAVSVVSCSKAGDGPEDPDPQTPPEAKLPKVTVSTRDNGKNIFEMMEFGLNIKSAEGDEDVPSVISGLYLEPFFDSIVWSIPAREARFRVFEPNHWYFHWSNYFFAPGELETYILGYKGDEVIYSWEFPLTVGDSKDFLGYNWEDITENQNYSNGYHDVFAPGGRKWSFATFPEIHDGVPSVEFFVFNGGWLSEEEEMELLFDRIHALYGEPDYSEADGELEERCRESFNYIKDGARPMCLWNTGRSRVVLLHDAESHVRYTAYAEPVRR